MKGEVNDDPYVQEEKHLTGEDTNYYYTWEEHMEPKGLFVRNQGHQKGVMNEKLYDKENQQESIKLHKL